VGKHDIMWAYLDTDHTPRARAFIHDEGILFQMNGIFRTVIGAHATLVTQVDTIIARSRKTAFNPQQGFG
jgi:hypothetical protein